jgi:hypothetical protein
MAPIAPRMHLWRTTSGTTRIDAANPPRKILFGTPLMRNLDETL